MSNRVWFRLLVALVVAGVAWYGKQRGGVTEGPIVESTAPVSPVPHSEIGFRDVQHLHEHYQKHGREFAGASETEYLRLAQALRDQPAGGDILEDIRADGVVTRFDRSSGAFIAFDRNLAIRTFFKPNDGERYYQRQLSRGHSEP